MQNATEAGVQGRNACGSDSPRNCTRPESNPAPTSFGVGPHMSSPEAEAQALAAAWRESGGVAAAMVAVRCGPPESALQAAKALGALVHDSGAQAELSAPGAVRAVLQVYTSEGVGPSNMDAFEFTVGAIVRACPSAPAQLIAAYTDPDPWCAFAAIFFSQKLLACPTAARRMLKAGAAKALVAAVSHPSPYCRSAAAALPDALPDSVANALVESGLVHALVGAVLGSPPASSPLPPSSPRLIDGTAGFIFPSGGPVTVPFKDPTHMALVALTRLAGSFFWAALEIFHLDDGAELVMQGLRAANPGVATASAELMCVVLNSFEKDTHLQVFCEPLMEGLPPLIPSLLRPEQPQLAAQIIRALFLLAVKSGKKFSIKSANTVLAALEDFYGSDGPNAASGDSLGESCLSAMSCIFEAHAMKANPSSRQLSTKLIEKLCRVMITGDWDAVIALELLTRAIQADASGASYEVAASGGFVLGVLRLFKALKSSTFPLGQVPSIFSSDSFFKGVDSRKPQPSRSDELRTWFLSNAKTGLQRGLLQIACGDSAHIMQAVNCGLLKELRGLLSSDSEHDHRIVLTVCVDLLPKSEGTARMRDAGVFPSLLLDLVDSPHVGLEFGQFLLEALCQDSDFRCRAAVGELEAAGVLAKVARAFPDLGLLNTCPHALRAAGSESLGSQAAAGPEVSISQDPSPGKRCSPSEKGPRELRLSKGPSADAGARTTPPHGAAPRKGEPPSQLCKTADDALIREQANSSSSSGPKKKSRVCVICGKGKVDGVELQACAGCNAVFYCGRECQRRDWPLHKRDCASRRSRHGQ